MRHHPVGEDGYSGGIRGGLCPRNGNVQRRSKAYCGGSGAFAKGFAYFFSQFFVRSTRRVAVLLASVFFRCLLLHSFSFVSKLEGDQFILHTTLVSRIVTLVGLLRHRSDLNLSPYSMALKECCLLFYAVV